VKVENNLMYLATYNKLVIGTAQKVLRSDDILLVLVLVKVAMESLRWRATIVRRRARLLGDLASVFEYPANHNAGRVI
jgi:hypothetical protein